MFSRISLIFILVLASGAVNAGLDGEHLFQKHCSSCHGSDGGGGVGVPLSLPSFINAISNDYLTKTIRLGRPGRIMPAFTKLSDAQIMAIITHMRSWSDKPVIEFASENIQGDAEQGKQLFTKHCAQCHGDKGQGGKGTGVTFSRKRDLPIIAPALNNKGFLASVSDQMLKHTLINGREGTPMVSALAAGISEDNIDDLVSYIRSMEKNIASTEKDEPIDDVIVMDSPYDMEETLDNLKQAITDQNFTLIRTDHIDHGFVEEEKENKQYVVLHFCNFGFLFQALAIDPRVGMFLPCRVTIVENEGKVQLMTINPMRLSRLFNNNELDEACKEMTNIYNTILEDSVL